MAEQRLLDFKLKRQAQVGASRECTVLRLVLALAHQEGTLLPVKQRDLSQPVLNVREIIHETRWWIAAAAYVFVDLPFPIKTLLLTQVFSALK